MGDIHPYLALAVELARNGHKPLLAFPPYARSLIEETGLEYSSIGPDLQGVQAELITAMQKMPDSAQALVGMFTPLVRALPQMFSELGALCAGADVLISGPMQPASRMIHELAGIPFVSVQENHFGGGGSPAFQQATASLINPFRLGLGLQPLRHPVTVDANSPQLALYAMSRHVTPPPPDWPGHYHMTGYFFMDGEQWQPYPELADFLAGGEPPVVISFGSMTHEDPAGVTDLILESVKQAGCRAILQQGWSGLGHESLPRDIHVAGFIPHTWLFDHAACVVHHGGPGTAAAAFRAGVPSVFVPHAFDQPIWSELARDMGMIAPIPFLELTAQRLSDAIKTTLATKRYYQVAAELRERIREERGVEKARILIEELVFRIGLCHESSRVPGRFSPLEDGNRRKHYQEQRRARKRTDRVICREFDGQVQ